jgi:hypothetical protein
MSIIQIQNLYLHPCSPIPSALSLHNLICHLLHNRCSQRPALHSSMTMLIPTPTYQIQSCSSIPTPPHPTPPHPTPPTSFHPLQPSQLLSHCLPEHSLPLPSSIIYTTLLLTHPPSPHIIGHYHIPSSYAASIKVPTTPRISNMYFNTDILSAQRIHPYRMYQNRSEKKNSGSGDPA